MSIENSLGEYPLCRVATFDWEIIERYPEPKTFSESAR